MIAIIPSATLLGVEGRPVAVEVHVSIGLPGYHVVGLPDTACRESRDRVRAALMSSGLQFPTKRITVNLAPGGVRKGGPGLDLPIAVGLLVASGEVPPEAVAGCGFLGELGLDGSLRRVPGVVPMVGALDASSVVVPSECGAEAAVLGRHEVRVASTMKELVACLRGQEPWPRPPAAAGRRLLPTTGPTWPTSGARRSVAPPWRCAPPAATTCSSRARPARGRRCWPGACPGCCRPSRATTLSTSPASTRPGACRSHPGGWCSGRRSGRPTTAPRRWHWSGAAPPGSGPAR